MSLGGQRARLYYDTSTGNLVEVTFRYDPSETMPGGCIEIEHDMGVAFLEGTLRLIDHVVALNDQNELVVIRREDLEQVRSFWELCNAESVKSPISVFDKTETGFSVRLAKRNQRFIIYVTERNDPNILLAKINSSELDMDASNNLFVRLSMVGDYSIYVRNHAA